jgi:hypothetical protein
MPYIPDEILDRIIFYLAPSPEATTNRDLHDILKVALVSKQWYCVTLPYLYAHLRAGKDGRSARIFATLVNKPLLGQNTKSLDASFSALTDHLPKKLLSPNFNWTEYMLNPRHQSQTHRDAFYKVTFSNALYYLPNLEHLNVLGYKKPLNKEEVPPWLRLIDHNSVYNIGIYSHWAEGPRFNNLKRLDANIRGVPIIELYPVFRLPALEILYLVGGKLHSTVSRLPNPATADSWEGITSQIKQLTFFGLKPGPHHQMGQIARAVPKLRELRVVGSRKRGLGANLHRAILATFMVRNVNVCKFKRLEMWDMKATAPDLRTPTAYWSSYTALSMWYEVEELMLDINIIQASWMHALFLPRNVKTLQIIAYMTEQPQSFDMWCGFKHKLREGINANNYPRLRSVTVHLIAQAHKANKFVRWDGNNGYQARGVTVNIQ